MITHDKLRSALLQALDKSRQQIMKGPDSTLHRLVSKELDVVELTGDEKQLLDELFIRFHSAGRKVVE